MPGSVLLIVVDKRDTRVLFNQALKSSPYRLTFATDGEDGFDRFSEAKPDLVITHTSTPKIDGSILIQLIRQQPAGKSVPIVLMSEDFSDGTSGPSRARSVDADGWLPLPFQKSKALEVIDRLLKTGRTPEADTVDEEHDTGEHVLAEAPIPKRRDPASSTDPDFHITLDEEDSEGVPLFDQEALESNDGEDEIDTGQTPAPKMDDAESANATVINQLPDEVSAAVAARTAPKGPLAAKAAALKEAKEKEAKAKEAKAKEAKQKLEAPPAPAAPAKPVVPARGLSIGKASLAAKPAPASISDLDVPIDVEEFDAPAEEPRAAAARPPSATSEPPLPNVRAPRAPSALGAGSNGGAKLPSAPRPPGVTSHAVDPASMLDEMPLPARSNRPLRFESTNAGRTPTAERIIREPKLEVTPAPDFAPTSPEELAKNIASNSGGHGLEDSRFGKRLVKSVQQISKLLDELDYYQLFDLEPSASQKEIRDKYFDKCIEFHPDRFFLLRSGDVKEKLYRIYRRLNEAYAVLSDERRRPRYDELLRTKTAKRMPPEERHTKKSEPAPDPGRTPQPAISANPAAQRFVEIARNAYDQTDLNTARLFLTFAAVYDPDNENIRRSLGEVAHARRRAF